MGDIHYVKGRYTNLIFKKYLKLHRNVLCEGDLALAQYISMGKIQNFEDFLKISRTVNLPNVWDLRSWHLGLPVKKKFRYPAKSLQVHVTTLYINKHLPLGCI